MTQAYFITHPDVLVEPGVAITQWRLSAHGRSRMHAIVHHGWVASLAHVFSSAERKAQDTAEILCASSDRDIVTLPELGEIDRSATGYMPPPKFWSVVEDFFAFPQVSARGWETAAAAQQRIVGAVHEGLHRTAPDEPVAFVAHGGVGCLLLCHLKGIPISSDEEQPPPPAGAASGAGGGYYFAFARSSLELRSDWQAIDAAPETRPNSR